MAHPRQALVVQTDKTIYYGKQTRAASIQLPSPAKYTVTAKLYPAPEYISTIFWKPFIVTGTDGKVNLYFYTSDLNGTFKITLEGIGANGEMVYKEALIKVNR